MSDEPHADAILDSPGTACAYLTPLIKESMAPLTTGQVLEVVSDDPSSRQGVQAWSRMKGNPLIACVTDGENSRFFLRKK
jgi:TusA-related sulfurtransferase